MRSSRMIINNAHRLTPENRSVIETICAQRKVKIFYERTDAIALLFKAIYITTGLTREQLQTKSRKYPAPSCRQIFSYWVHTNYPKYTYLEIGRMINCSHVTVCENIESYRKNNIPQNKQYYDLVQRIYAVMEGDI